MLTQTWVIGHKWNLAHLQITTPHLGRIACGKRWEDDLQPADEGIGRCRRCVAKAQGRIELTSTQTFEIVHAAQHDGQLFRLHTTTRRILLELRLIEPDGSGWRLTEEGWRQAQMRGVHRG